MEDKSISRKQKRDRLTPPRCEIPGCEWTYNFQRHRIHPGREGGKYKLGNVIALCPNHHSLADDDLLPREYLSEIVRLRIKSEEVNAEPTDRTPDAEIERSDSPEESGESTGGCSADADDGIEAGSTGE